MSEFQSQILHNDDGDPNTINQLLVNLLPKPENFAGLEDHRRTVQSNLEMLSIICTCQTQAPVLNHNIGKDAAKFYRQFLADFAVDLLCSPKRVFPGQEGVIVSQPERVEVALDLLVLALLAGDDNESYKITLIHTPEVCINLLNAMNVIPQIISDMKQKDHLVFVVRILAALIFFGDRTIYPRDDLVKCVAERIVDLVDSNLTSYEEKTDILEWMCMLPCESFKYAVLHGAVEKIVNKVRDLPSKIAREGEEARAFYRQVAMVLKQIIAKSTSGLERFMEVEGMLEKYGLPSKYLDDLRAIRAYASLVIRQTVV